MECELCRAQTVQRATDSPPGVEAWRCTVCGDFKRWCPECNQGWIRRFRVPGADTEIYSCDECEAAWQSVPALLAPGVDRRSLLQQLGPSDASARLVLVRERTSEPPSGQVDR